MRRTSPATPMPARPRPNRGGESRPWRSRCSCATTLRRIAEMAVSRFFRGGLPNGEHLGLGTGLYPDNMQARKGCRGCPRIVGDGGALSRQPHGMNRVSDLETGVEGVAGLVGEIRRWRASMAGLLAEVLETTDQLERWLGVADGFLDTSRRVEERICPVAQLGSTFALVLRKARTHAEAVLRANAGNSMHSLGVQMRTVLECAGQVVYALHYLRFAPEAQDPVRAMETFGNRINADFYQTFRRAVRGLSKKRLREMAVEAQEAAARNAGAPAPTGRRTWALRQTDKADTLRGGRDWYSHLSSHFMHGGEVDWDGSSWRGGVVSNDSFEDELGFLLSLDYLTGQVATMNAYAALFPVDEEQPRWMDRALEQVRVSRELSDSIAARFQDELGGS